MNAKILQKGEKIFLPNDEKIDKKCYEINNIENWANCFYNLKSGKILERYKLIISRTENNKFFEALNYEYGINNFPLDTNKAFQIYKEASDTSNDTLSMFRLYRIYKKDYKKFNIRKRNFVLEKFYIMKCFAYLTKREKDSYLYSRFNIGGELEYQLFDENGNTHERYSELIKFLFKNYKMYNINIEDIILIDSIMNKKFFKRDVCSSIKKLGNLTDNGFPEAIYNMGVIFDVYNKKLYLEKLIKMNYYRSACDYADTFNNREEALIFLKKSLLNGYYSHIKWYKKLFFNINDIEDIFRKPQLKSELMFIFGAMIDAIIADEIEILMDYIYLRKVSIKHFNFAEEFNTYLDLFTRQILDYLMNFTKGTDEENKRKIKLYYINNDFQDKIYTKFSMMYYQGVIGLMEHNLNEALNKLDYIEKYGKYLYEKKYYQYLKYKIKQKERKIKKKNKEIINDKDEDLIKLENQLIKMYYEDFTPEKIKNFPPSLFYILSKLYGTSSISNKDIIFEYVLLNRASNASLLKVNDNVYDSFEQKYFQYKAKKKLEEKNKEENFSELKMAKGIINVEGYGEDGTICPICFENKKSSICLPCKHFFCGRCLKKLLDKGKCPICRTDIKITFDFNLKQENLIQSILSNSYIY